MKTPTETPQLDVTHAPTDARAHLHALVDRLPEAVLAPPAFLQGDRPPYPRLVQGCLTVSS